MKKWEIKVIDDKDTRGIDPSIEKVVAELLDEGWEIIQIIHSSPGFPFPKWDRYYLKREYDYLEI